LASAVINTTLTSSTWVLCPYSFSLIYSAELCTIWCQIQELNGSQRRCAICPPQYTADPSQAELLCQLWLVLQNLEAKNINLLEKKDKITSSYNITKCMVYFHELRKLEKLL
jgi:hypothetical protein